ncbi:unnamed protein product [Nezara viridula]|uniref:NADP-dependent oxidoreductase domain-containing protein n=1 Tax=Nezara viridula TaxID=85310 RepID=A0A9P0HF53_NEZVI|nr:unnamed protein product [Nezara viridula]
MVKSIEKIYLSQLWNNKHEKEAVVPALKKTLANLGLQYVDLYMIQWPFSVPDIPGEFFPRGKNNKVLTTETDFKSTWKGMEECVEKGLAKSIGLCNFNIRQIREINFSTRIRPTVVQVECHPYLSQVELINYCRSLEIIVTAYMPQGKKLPPMKGRSLLNDPVLNTLARKYNKTPSQIALRYQLDRGLAVIPKSSKKARLEENFNVFDFSISEKDVLVLDCLNKNERYLDLKEYNQHKHYPFQYDNNDQDILHDAHHDILHDVHHDVHNEVNQ